MTTGNILMDSTTPHPSGIGWTGMYYSKSWNGSDNGTSVKKPVKPAKVPSFSDYVQSVTGRLPFRIVKDANSGKLYRKRNLNPVTIYRLRLEHSEMLNRRAAAFRDYLISRGGWLKERMQHEHDYSMNSVKRRSFPGRYKAGSDPWVDAALQSTFGYAISFREWTSNDDITLANKLYAKLDGDVGNHFSLSFAEIDKTAQMIRENATTLRVFGEAAATGDMKNAAIHLRRNTNTLPEITNGRVRKGIGNGILWYMFGVLPLLESVREGAAALAWHTHVPSRTRIQARHVLKDEGPGPAHGMWLCPWSSSNGKNQVVFLDHNPSFFEASFNFWDIPMFLWERQMFSFLVDWWVPVGNYLSAMKMQRIVSDSTVVTTTRTIGTQGGYSSGSWYEVEGGEHDHYSSAVVDRTVTQGLAVPLPTLKPLIHPKRAVKVTHAIEAIALLQQREKQVVQGIGKFFQYIGRSSQYLS